MGNVSTPISLNQWVYVGDNPIMRTDPSGFCYIDDSSSRCIPPEHPTYYPNGLTEGSLYNTPVGEAASYNSQVKSYGGQQLWQVYLQMTCEQNTWWYADQANAFNLEMFIGLMILQEANIKFTPGDETNVTLDPNYRDRAELVTEVVGTVIKYGGHKNYGCYGISCLSSIFNFWAEHSQVAHNLMNDYYHLIYDDREQRSIADSHLDKYAEGGPASIGVYYSRKTGNRTPSQLLKVLSEANRLGNNALHNPAYQIQNGPIMYGLNSHWTNQLGSAKYNIRAGTRNGIDSRTVYYYTPDGIIFYTESQYGHWHAELGDIVDQTDPMPIH
jgi:hypothetical protein